MPERAEVVASVPYDTVDTDEARKLAEGNPESFLHIVRSEIDLPPGTDIHADAVYAKAAENLARFRSNGTLIEEETPCFYVYRQRMGDHVQRGVVGCCHVDEYRNDLVRKHEKTRPDKENDRTRHMTTLEAHAGPVFTTYRDSAEIDAVVAEIEKSDPLFDFTARDGIAHTVWRVTDTATLVHAFGRVPLCYIADGHHRAASAARAASEVEGPNGEQDWFECVLFPASQLQILPYNRCVHDLNGLLPDELLAAAGKAFTVSEDVDPNPGGVGRISMYLDGKWHGLERSNGTRRTGDPTGDLDVSYLQENLLGPVLGVEDPRTDKRIEFIGGIRGTDELRARVDDGRAAAAFSMFPVTVEQMMAIADAGMIMPPKSTWFEPKLRSGLLVHLM